MKTERRTLPATDISELPKPRPGRSGFRLGLLAVLALLAVSAAAYWLTRDDDAREALRQQAVSAIDKVTEGTPLAGVSKVLTPPPPPALTAARRCAIMATFIGGQETQKMFLQLY